MEGSCSSIILGCMWWCRVFFACASHVHGTGHKMGGRGTVSDEDYFFYFVNLNFLELHSSSLARPCSSNDL